LVTLEAGPVIQTAQGDQPGSTRRDLATSAGGLDERVASRQVSVRSGTRLDERYRLAARIGEGRLGVVWRATDEILNRGVAVKILRPELAASEAFVLRFRTSVRTVSGLPHQGIAAVYDYGQTRDDDANQVVYLVTELVAGEALSSMLARDGAIGPSRTLTLVGQAARALDAAHLRGIVHGCITPSNLMVTPDDQVKVTDFGAPRSPVEPQYMAPELANGHDISPLSDVYALGVTIYECLAGGRPFTLDGQRRPMPATVPAPIQALIRAATHADQRLRIPSAVALANALLDHQ
jgi:serine/threonine protein kinase